MKEETQNINENKESKFITFLPIKRPVASGLFNKKMNP